MNFLKLVLSHLPTGVTTMLLRILLFCLFVPLLHAWSHLELGAANYGQAKSSQKPHDPNVQYRVLFWTVEELVDRYGPEEGIFYVNDLHERACEYCVEKLQDYIEMQGYQISVVSLPGDYQTLKWDKPLLDSIHLKNPESRFFKNRTETRAFLSRLASYSKEGLHLFILYSNAYFPKAEKTEFVDQGKFYHPTDEWEPVIYYGPRGHTIENGRVFQIFPEGINLPCA